MIGGTMSGELQSATRPRPYAAVRTLQIEAEGDFCKGLIKPKIRIMGRWLEQAGFKPGYRVQVTCVEPGVIELRAPDTVSLSALELPAVPPPDEPF
jgi:hypothetical protein